MGVDCINYCDYWIDIITINELKLIVILVLNKVVVLYLCFDDVYNYSEVEY